VLPGAFPLIGHIPEMYDDILSMFRDAVAKVGPLFWVDFGFGLWNLVCTAPEVTAILRNRGAASRHLGDMLPNLVAGTVLTADGPRHQHLRSVMNSPFTPRGLGATRVLERQWDLIEGRVRGWADGRPIAVLRETRELGLHVLFRLIGLPVPELDVWCRKYEEYVLGAFAVPLTLPGTPAWRSRRGRAWLIAGLRRLVSEARARGEGDFLHSLASARDEHGASIDEDELLTNLLFFTLAGHETNASTMAWMALHLAQDRDCWERLVAEARAFDPPRHPGDLRRFPFAEALFREVLRLHPPAHLISRVTTAPLELLGRAIPVGTIVAVPITLLSRDPARYSEPDRFRPERWLDRAEPITPLETIQFGAGPHFCLGYHVALLESMQFVVALGRTLGSAGQRLRLAGPFPRSISLPLGHPDPAARLIVV
jgi:cytochrome P450 family 117 subfamily A